MQYVRLLVQSNLPKIGEGIYRPTLYSY